jgi:DNA-binding NarL/FixJ family response regulator
MSQATRSAQKRISVGLFSYHPLVAAEFERLLPQDEFEVWTHRLEPPPMTGSEELAVSPASVYVLEASGVGRVTEALVESLARSQRANRLIIIAERFDEAETFPLLALGVKGLICFADAREFLARAIREVARGGFWVPRPLLSRFVDWTLATGRPRTIRSAARLSSREREVVELLLKNLSNKEIAVKLRISERTAKFHVSNLLAKHGVKRRADLILLGVARGDRLATSLEGGNTDPGPRP